MQLAYNSTKSDWCCHIRRTERLWLTSITHYTNNDYVMSLGTRLDSKRFIRRSTFRDEKFDCAAKTI